MLRVEAGSWRFEDAGAVQWSSEKPLRLSCLSATEVPFGVSEELRWIYHDVLSVSGYFSVKWKEVILTPDTYIAASIKRVKCPVRKQDR